VLLLELGLEFVSVMEVAQVVAVFKLSGQVWLVKLGWSSLDVHVGVCQSGVFTSCFLSFDGVNFPTTSR
jgi:hypothetical protein